MYIPYTNYGANAEEMKEKKKWYVFLTLNINFCFIIQHLLDTLYELLLLTIGNNRN